MGAVEFNNAIFLNITEGKLARRVQSPNDKSVTRVTKTGKTVHEVFYRGWKGRITNIRTRENEYGKDWLITLTDEQGDAIIQMPYSSGYSGAFLKALPNVDLSKEIQLTPSLKVEGDKKSVTVFINQGGQPIKWAFTKDTPNGLPPMVKIKVKGKDTWDDSDQMAFLEKMVNEQILPKLKTQPAQAEADEDSNPPF